MLETVRGAGYRFTANPHVAVSLSD
jgi:DNA-binding winged helix-turn-helix (wHTH) protein